MSIGTESEQVYETVFGETFAAYSKEEMIEFIHPFEVRFERNNIDPKEVFSGARCLDAGCGNGRGSIFMLQNGAAHVEALDVSAKNIENVTRYAAEFGFSDQLNANQASLEDVPFEDGEFDFVWCNGVVMHTRHPNQCLSELSRVLKFGGRGWFYLYGSGGLYWRVIQEFRRAVASIGPEKTIAYLRHFRYSNRYVAEFIDDWFAAHLRTYTHEDLQKRLSAVGLDPGETLWGGMDYDTSQRHDRATTQEERDLVGEGDLRYLVTKKEERGPEFELNEGEYGSDYPWPAAISEFVESNFAKFPQFPFADEWQTIAICGHLQRVLRILMDQEGEMPLDAFARTFDYLAAEVEVLAKG